MMKIVRLYYVESNFITIKFGYNVRSHCWAKAVTPSAKLLYVRPFPGLLSSLFSLMESEILEKASRQVTTEEPS